MAPPRRPKADDSTKRKMELRAEPAQPTATDDELAEWEKTFSDF
jgi:hypothetical protein